MILCEFFPDVCKGIEFKKGRIKEVYSIDRSEVLEFLKKKRKLVRGILINPGELFYEVTDKKFSRIAKNIVDEQFPDIKERRWQKFEDLKGRIHIASIDGTELDFVRELVKTSRAQCEIIDVSAFNVTNFVIKFYEGIKNGVVLNVTDEVTYAIYVKKRMPFWGNSFPTSEFPEFLKKQINYVFSAAPEIKDSFKIYANFASAGVVQDLGNLKENLKFDIVPIDPTGIAKNLKKSTDELPSAFTALIGLSLRFQ